MSKTLSRREFLKGAAIGAAGVAAIGTGIAVAAEGTAEAEYQYDMPAKLDESCFTDSPVIREKITEFAAEYTYDVVVVGAGTGGVPAALSALEEGATACVLEKQTVAISQGNGGTGIDLLNSNTYGLQRYMRGFHEDCGWRSDHELLKTYVSQSGEAMNWLLVRAHEAGILPASISETNREYDDGGYMKSFTVSYGPKPANMGTMIVLLAELAAQKGVDFYYETPGVQLIMDSGKCVGVIGRDEDGNYIKFNANKAVVLSTGDYQNNSGLVEKFCPDVAGFDKKQFGKTGDGILMAMCAGGGIVRVGHAHMMHDFDSGPMYSIPFVCVDEEGVRFVNEEFVFHDINNQLRDHRRPGWYTQVFDADYETYAAEWGYRPTPASGLENYMKGKDEYGPGVYPGLVDTYMADTLEELAEKIGLPVDAFVASIERYNTMCEQGLDEDFGRKPQILTPIKNPPFYGIHKHIRISALCAGVTVNGDYQVVDEERNPIFGLYATGFGAGQLCGKADWSMYQSGMSIGHCVTSGRMCGILAATGKRDPSVPVTNDDAAPVVALVNG